MRDTPQLSPTSGAVALTTATPADVAGLTTLQEGTYLVWGVVDVALAAATITAFAAALSFMSGTLPSQQGAMVSAADLGRLFPGQLSQRALNLVTATGTERVVVGPTVLTVSAPQGQVPLGVKLYLTVQATFSAGAVSATGTIHAVPLAT